MFKPYIPAEKKIPELSIKSIVLGIILGFFFAIGNAYLGLRIGATISASIPAAIISMGVFKALFKNKANILENNMVQTITTMGEGLAAGVIFTIPALFFLSDPPSIGRIFLLTTLGGILGVLFMIPMRRYIIVKEHGVLPFPEGTACAEILKTGEAEHQTASYAFWAFGISTLYKVLSGALSIWTEKVTWIFNPFQKSVFSVEATPALLGVGYIIGQRVTSIMFAGGVLAWWIIIPIIRMFGTSDLSIYPSEMAVSAMSSQEIWSSYIRYIGAGTVATGGLLSLIRIGPLIFKTVHVGFKELFGRIKDQTIPRTDQDISLKWLILGSLAVILTLWLFPGLPMNLFTIILLTILGFFFVAVTSITVGIVGTTSNPVSGMTITTLLITSLLFVLLGWTEKIYLIAAITMSAVANVAIATAGATSQDLKAGYLLGSTPRLQQYGEIIGIFIPALALGGTVYILNAAYQLGSEYMPAPQATLMALIAKGVISGDLPYTLVIIGVLIGLLMELIKIPVLPFAIGLYLPLSLTTGTLVGGLVSGYVQKHSQSDEAKEKGILIASGLVGGDTCTGIIIALLTVLGVISLGAKPLLPDIFALITYAALALGTGYFVIRQKKQSV